MYKHALQENTKAKFVKEIHYRPKISDSDSAKYFAKTPEEGNFIAKKFAKRKRKGGT